MDSFISHVSEQHLPPPPAGPAHDHTHTATPHTPDSVGVCRWYGCQFKTVSAASKEFTVHVLFHTYHSYLKLLGKEYQDRQVLPVCHVDPGLVNVLPLIEIELKCLWDYGKCGEEFDCVSSFYAHVHGHVHAVATGNLTCRWQGKLDT